MQVQAETLLTLATAQGFPLYLGFGTCWRGWALALQGQGEAGMAQMHQGLAALLAIGQALSRPFYLVLLAEAAGHVGQVEEGLCLLTEALRSMRGQRAGRHAGGGVSVPGRIAAAPGYPRCSPG